MIPRAVGVCARAGRLTLRHCGHLSLLRRLASDASGLTASRGRRSALASTPSTTPAPSATPAASSAPFASIRTVCAVLTIRGDLSGDARSHRHGLRRTIHRFLRPTRLGAVRLSLTVGATLRGALSRSSALLSIPVPGAIAIPIATVASTALTALAAPVRVGMTMLARVIAAPVAPPLTIVAALVILRCCWIAHGRLGR